MRERVAQGLIALAWVLLAADFAWVLPRLARYLETVVHDSPEAVILAGALLALVAARLVRRAPRTEKAGEDL